ncbi:MAG TPA: adenylate kinase [Microlunatus sp.]|nr:adenylate kinase [Microlunatus sp.]
MRLLIMGPPGAGKGTQAKRIGEHYAIPAISTGDIFRAMQTADTPLARQVREIMASGGYVSDEITNQIVAERLADADCEPGFLLDGYPRTLKQVDNLDAHLASVGKPLDKVVSLTANEDEVVDRLLKRAQIEGRADDNEETIRKRQQVYAEQTAPLLEVYADRGLLVEVDGLGSVDEVSERIFAALG